MLGGLLVWEETVPYWTGATWPSVVFVHRWGTEHRWGIIGKVVCALTCPRLTLVGFMEGDLRVNMSTTDPC